MKWPWSYWEHDLIERSYDLLIVGAGFSGLASAYFIKQKKPDWKILILEAAYRQRSASTRNAGFACISSLSELMEDVKSGGWEDTLDLIEKRWKGLELIKREFSGKDIHYQKVSSGEFFFEGSEYRPEEYFEHMDEANRQIKKVTGFNYYKKLPSPPGFVKNTVGYIEHAEEAQLHPGLLLKAWEAKCTGSGVKLLENCQVKQLLPNDNSKGIGVDTSAGRFQARKVLLCTNGKWHEGSQYQVAQNAVNYVFVTRPIPAWQSQFNLHAESGYIYIRNIGNRLLIGGGRNHLEAHEQREELEQTKSRVKDHLLRIAKMNITGLPDELEIEFEWSGFLGVGKKKQPILKEVENNIFLLGRLSGMGVALSGALGKEIADKIMEI